MKSKRKRDKQSRRSVVSISNVSVGFETLHSFRRNNYKLVSASDGFNCLSISGTNSAQLHGAICHSNHLQHTEDEVIEMVHLFYFIFIYFFSYTQTHQITTSKRANEQRTVSGRNALVLDFLIAPDRCSSGKDSTAQKCVSPSKSHHSIMWNKL